MGKMSNEQILAFAKEFADRIYEIGWYLLDEEVIRTHDITISLDYLVRLAEAKGEGYQEEYKKHFKYPDGWYESEDRLEDIVPRVAEDAEIEAVMFCEGELWEALYYCEAYGSKDKKAKAIYEAFIKAAQNHDLWYEWGEGIVFLYGVLESYRLNSVDYAQREVKYGKINRSIYGRWCSKRSHSGRHLL